LVVTSVLAQALAADQLARVVFVAGIRRDRVRFVISARRAHYDVVVAIASHHRGYFTMKLAALAIGIGARLWYYDETSESFEVAAGDTTRLLAVHLTDRLKGSSILATAASSARMLCTLLGEPIGIIVMLVAIVRLILRARFQGSDSCES
jgi:hypothetical protein